MTLLKRNHTWMHFFSRLFLSALYMNVVFFFTICDQSFHLFRWRNADINADNNDKMTMKITKK